MRQRQPLPRDRRHVRGLSRQPRKTMTHEQSLSSRVREIKNLTDFAKRSGIPHRTLVRIKAARDNYAPSTTTRMALEAALNRFKSNPRGKT